MAAMTAHRWPAPSGNRLQEPRSIRGRLELTHNVAPTIVGKISPDRVVLLRPRLAFVLGLVQVSDDVEKIGAITVTSRVDPAG